MDERPKLSLKRVEISLGKFNDVAIPHHLDLLRQHKLNIAKFESTNELTRVRSEQTNARRVVAQLGHLLAEIDGLRGQVEDAQVTRFDALTARSRQRTLAAIQDFLNKPPLIIGTSTPTRRASVQSTASQDSASAIIPRDLQLVVDDTRLQEQQLRAREDCLREWEALHSELSDLHDVFLKFNDVVESQRESVDEIEDNAESSAHNVSVARVHLAKAEKYKIPLYPVAGAFLGGCLAGPLGLVAGLKIGGLALIGGSILGFTGGSFLKKKKDEQITNQLTNAAGETEEESKNK